MKLNRTLLIALLIVGLTAPIALHTTDAQALSVTYTGVTPGNYDIYNGYYAGLYNLSVDGQTILGMCDDFLTHVPDNAWQASLNTKEDILQGKGRWGGNLATYNALGYLFMKTFEATSGAQLADINAAIWKVTYSGLNLTGSAQTLYEDAINQTNFTGWYGKMYILTPEYITGTTTYASQEYLVQAPVPEPATLILLGTGLLGIAGIGRKKFKR